MYGDLLGTEGAKPAEITGCLLGILQQQNRSSGKRETAMLTATAARMSPDDCPLIIFAHINRPITPGHIETLEYLATVELPT